MTPLEFLSRYVMIKDYCKQLYHRIFSRNLTNQQDALNRDDRLDSEAQELDEPVIIEPIKHHGDIIRLLPFENLDKAMSEVLGFHGTADKIAEIRELLEIDRLYYNDIEIDFRTWCGIVAFSERYLISLEKDKDPCDEVLTIKLID